MRASPTAELVFEDVTVPAANLVGTEAPTPPFALLPSTCTFTLSPPPQGGASLCMMRNLEIERLVLAAMSVGIARRSLQVQPRFRP